MFFIASKIVWALLSPLAFILLLFLLGTVSLLFSFTRTAIFFLFTAIFIFCVLGLLPIGPDLLAGLENQYNRPYKMPQKVAGIVVLGGSFETEFSESHGFPVATQKIQRVLDGLRLAKAYPEAKLVFSGGEGSLFHQDHPESKDIQSFLKMYGLQPSQEVVFEEKSRNTLENLEYTRHLVAPKPGETWLLVTSAWHMKRAMDAAQQAGWQGIIPYPSDYRTNGGLAGPEQVINVRRNLDLADLALHEYAGLLAYRLVKKSPSGSK
jgi:uncharacterized SAM-binding protein YcdF (DUF218 family)